MSEKKYNNKILLAVLAVLAVVFFATNLFRDQSRSAQQLPDEILSLDTARVQAIAIASPRGEAFRVQRQNGAWQLEADGRAFAADAGVARRVLGELEALEPERLVSRSEDAWAKYAVDDSSATRITLTSEGGQSQDLFIGRFNYQPPPGGMNAMGQNQQISGTTYVRRGEGSDVYSVDGFLAMTLPSDAASWRLPDFLRISKPAIRELRFQYPDAAFTVSRLEGDWRLDGSPADSMTVETYLNQFINRPNRQFADDFSAATPPTHTLSLRGDNMDDLVIQAWPGAEDSFILHSSLNPGAYFESPADGVFQQLFVDRSHFGEGGS